MTVLGDRSEDARALAADVAAALADADVGRAIGVADSQLADVLAALARVVPVSYVVREDVAVAMAAGAALAGEHVAVFMKNAGLGPSLDAIMSLGLAAELPLTLVVGWAGVGSDHLHHHVVAGERTEAILHAVDVDVEVVRPTQAIDSAALAGRIRASWAGRRSIAVLVEP